MWKRKKVVLSKVQSAGYLQNCEKRMTPDKKKKKKLIFSTIKRDKKEEREKEKEWKVWKISGIEKGDDSWFKKYNLKK